MDSTNVPGHGATAAAVVGPVRGVDIDAERILRSLPAWFGIESALQEYVRDTALHPTFAIEDAGRLEAFLTLRQHFAGAWEIHCLAVHADRRGRGLGRRLLAHVEAWLRGRDARWLQVKTLDASHPSAAYAQTRRFYLANGFEPLETFDALWGAGTPALQLVKSLRG